MHLSCSLPNNFVYCTIVLIELQADPELAQVLLGNDLNRLQELLRQRNHQKSALKRQQDEELVSNVDFPSQVDVACLILHIALAFIEISVCFKFLTS